MNELNKNSLKVIISFIISAFIITIIHNFNINIYTKNIIIPTTILLISYIYNIKKLKLDINKKSYYLLIPIILILISNLILKIDPSNIFLNIIIIPILLSIFLFKLTNKNYQLKRNFLKYFFKLFPNNLFNNLKEINLNLNISKKIKKEQINNIMKGLCIGLTLAVILLSLLTSADTYFNLFIENLTNNIFNIPSFNNIISNIIIFILMFTILFSTFINLIKNKNTRLFITIKETDHTSANIILTIINTVFILFLISEISKITTNFLNIPQEYTYANYAREGFFQLLTVTTINSTIILYYLYYTNIIQENKLLKKLILILISFSILLVFNSYYRMFLYINAYGFTNLRLQVLLFLLMELILFIILIKKIRKNLKHKDSTIFATIIITTYIINIYTCNDQFINFINNLINK